jgi:hypothetical protein
MIYGYRHLSGISGIASRLANIIGPLSKRRVVLVLFTDYRLVPSSRCLGNGKQK